MASIYDLASIIQGEASNPNDQFGVASTIYNRAQQWGGTAISQATAPGQFSAWPNATATPTPYAIELATAAQNGTLSQYGNTGNALYYNAPGYNAAYASGVGNNYGSGTNQYSDLYNQAPSSNFVLPQANSANDPLGTSVSVAGEYDTASGLPYDTGTAYTGDTSNLISDLGGGSSPLPSDPASVYSGSTANLAQQLGGGTPLPGQQNTGEASIAGQSVQKGLGTAGTDVQQSASGIAGTLASGQNLTLGARA